MFSALIGEIAILAVVFLLGAAWYKKKCNGSVSIYTELKEDVVSVVVWIKDKINGIKKPVEPVEPVNKSAGSTKWGD